MTPAEALVIFKKDARMSEPVTDPDVVVALATYYIDVFDVCHLELEQLQSVVVRQPGTAQAKEAEDKVKRMFLYSKLMSVWHFASLLRLSARKLKKLCAGHDGAEEVLQRINDCTIRQVTSSGFDNHQKVAFTKLLAEMTGEYQQAMKVDHTTNGKDLPTPILNGVAP